MMLLVDLGNSSLKWSTYDGALFSRMVRCAWEESMDIVVAQWSRIKPPRRIIISSVVDHVREQRLVDWIQEQWGLTPEFMRSAVEACGVVNAYREPVLLGVDRWSAMIAAHNQYDQAVCVVDCGTAVTIDVILADGRHQGGLIVPGYDLMFKALAGGTNIKFTDDHVQKNKSLLACDTQNAVQNGCLYSIASLIDRVVSQLREEMGVEFRCVVTGGNAGQVCELLRTEYRLVPDLVLQGLAYMAKEFG